jgi:hypothetical protein
LLGFGGWAMWSWMEHGRIAERRTLETRLSALETLALAPGSPLACLGAAGNEAVEGACEHSLFASPESAAAGISYTTARLALLNDALGYAGRQDPAFELVVEPLRAGLERDRFGFVAHVLVQRKNCTAERCDALRSFHDAERIRANLKENTFEGHVARAASGWGSRSTAQTPAAPDTQARAPQPPGYSLPSAASIPPVSIMANEPGTPASAPPAAPAATPPNPPRRPAARPAQPRRQSTTTNPPAAPAPSTRVQ